MKVLRTVSLLVTMMLMVSVSFAGGFFFTCDVGGAKIEIAEYNGESNEVAKKKKNRRSGKFRDATKGPRILDGSTKRNNRRSRNCSNESVDESINESVGGFLDGGECPRLFDIPRYSDVTIRVSAPGYETFEGDFENIKLGLNHFNITLIPVNDSPAGLPVFAFGGNLISSRGLRGRYKVFIRNITTYEEGNGQVSENMNLTTDDGWYSGYLVNKHDNAAVKVGDNIGFIVRNHADTRTYGEALRTITEEDMEKGYMVVDIDVR